jgi:outer membrane receptor protein involved in Fe transport
MAVSALCVAPFAHGAEPAHLREVNALDVFSLFDHLRVQPPPTLLDTTLDTPPEIPRSLNLFRKVEHDDLDVFGFVASRTQDTAADYRVYLGVGYSRTLGGDVRLIGRTYYGAGTYDGVNEGSSVPEEVRSATGTPSGWMGTNWSLESKLSSRHTFRAGVEYGQSLALVPAELNELLGRPAANTGPERRIGIVTTNEITLSPELSLNVRMRYDEDGSTARSSVDPRVELLYKPHDDTTLRARFDQAMGPRFTPSRAFHPWVTAGEESDRIRNYELAYEKRLTSKHKLVLSAYRYDVDGLFATNAESGALNNAGLASIDTRGFEVGMERNGSRTRARLSYAWQKTTDWLLKTRPGNLDQHLTKVSMNVPLWDERLSTALELQYLEVAGPLIGNERSEYLIGNLTIVSGRLAGPTRVSLGMHNLFDEHDDVKGARLLSYIPADGRSLRLDVSRSL